MKNNNYLSLFAFLFSLVFMVSCGDDDTPPPGLQVELGEGHVLVLNEGNFTVGNASVTAFDTGGEETIQDLFSQVNERPVGDVLQSAQEAGGKLCLVVNNSGTIEVVDEEHFGVQISITGLNSPRFLLEMDDNRALVTDIDSLISEVDLSNGTIISQIDAGDWSEHITDRVDDVLFTYPNQKKLGIISSVSLTGTIDLPGYPVGMVQTDDDNVWVLCQVNQWDNSLMSLARIDGGSTEVNESYEFAGGSGFGLRMKAYDETLYLMVGDLFKFDYITDSAPELFIEAGTRTLYGLGVDPNNEDVYLSDAKDYAQPGTVDRYNSSGTLIESFASGINPGEFYFYR